MNRITKKEHPEISVIMSVYNQRNAGRLKQSIMSVLGIGKTPAQLWVPYQQRNCRRILPRRIFPADQPVFPVPDVFPAVTAL